MKKIKIGIVEDELLIARTIIATIHDLGYEVTEAAVNFEEAIELMEGERPDLMLLDINLNEDKDGIDIASAINEQFKLPFIFLTANSDQGTIERAKRVKPHAYLIKPFQKEELYAAIEIAMVNFEEAMSEPSAAQPAKGLPPKDSIVVKDGESYCKINLSEIVYLESDHNYVTIHTNNKKKYIVRFTLGDLLERLTQLQFMRIHRSYAVRIEAIERINSLEVELAGVKLPIGRQAREELLQRWDVLK